MPPWLCFYGAALLLAVAPKRLQGTILVATPLLSAALFLTGTYAEGMTLQIAGRSLVLCQVDALSKPFLLIFHFAALLGAVFALHLRDRLQHGAALFYIGSALGALLAGDLISLLLFWELMAFSSAILVWAGRGKQNLRTALRYLVLQLISGQLLLAGTVLLIQQGTGTGLNPPPPDSPAYWLLLAAFGLKCAFPPTHNWLTEAYPSATPTGTVFLSAFTTKVAVYALARFFTGEELLIYIGALMACFPIFYAVIENDLRRVLCYSMINQLGFMVCGLGVGTALAVNGAVAHACNDIVFKSLLFMSMGAVLHVTGIIEGSRLGGLYRKMPRTAALCIIGAASISAFPLFSGFVSKSLIMSALLMEGHHTIWLVMLFASAGVFHHAGIKIPYFAFFAHDAGLKAHEAPRNMLIAMTLAAAFCILIGCFPSLLYAQLPHEFSYSAYDAGHVLAQLQLLCFSALAFIWLNLSGRYPPELPSVNLDMEWFYRSLGANTWRRACTTAARMAHIWNTRCNHFKPLLREAEQSLLERPGLSQAANSGLLVYCLLTLLTLLLLYGYAL